jgi:two-component system phosphate regulon sensor histidine kinase PhoR
MVDRLTIRFAVLGPALLRLALLAVIGAVVGALAGAVVGLWVAIVGLVILLAIHMSYATRLAAWLESPNLDEIPNGWGLWADVFARLYRQRRATEINERRLLENEERFRRTISALPEGIVLADASLQIDWCNPVAEAHLGIRLSADQ